MLTSQQLEAINYLCYTDMNYTEIADKLGVSTMTLYRWRHDAQFQMELDKELQAKVEAVRDQLKRDIEVVHGVMYDIVTDKSASDSDRIAASKFLIEQTLGKAVTNIDMKAHTTSDVKVKVSEKDILSMFDEEV